MKLYTEEQMSAAINAAKANPEQAYLIQAMLTPIELPSDEDIDEMSKSYINHINTMVHKDLERDGYLAVGFLKGAKNIINKIKGDNK